MGCVAVSQGSKTYTLRSTLDHVLIERAALTNKHIFEVEAADAPDDVDDAEPGTRRYGSLIAWNSASHTVSLYTRASGRHVVMTRVGRNRFKYCYTMPTVPDPEVVP